MDGGTGIDTIDHTAWNGPYTINMTTGLTNFDGESYTNFENINMGNGPNTVTGTGAANIINGGTNADTIFGGGGTDTINGGDGNDTIDGEGANDTINGGNGNDVIFGGLGQDSLTGGAGADTFKFNSVIGSPNAVTRDTIFNFTWSEGDKIDISGIDANQTIAGDQAFALAQLSFDSTTNIMVADVIGAADFSVSLVGVQAAFSLNLDVIA